MVDAADLKSAARKGVGVRVPLRALCESGSVVRWFRCQSRTSVVLPAWSGRMSTVQDQCLAPETMPDERGRRIFLAWVQSQQIVKFRTKKDTVNQALTEFIQRRKQLGVLDWEGKGERHP